MSKDLSVPGDTKCFKCFQWVPDEDYQAHAAWHHNMELIMAHPTMNVVPATSTFMGICAGMPVADAINFLCGHIKRLEDQVKNLEALAHTEAPRYYL